MLVGVEVKTKCVSPPILSKAKHTFGGRLFWPLGVEKRQWVWVGRNSKKIFLKKYVPNHEVEQLEDEYLHLKMEDTDYRKYTSRFLEISGLIPDFAGSESKRIGRFIWGAHPEVRANMKTSKPRTIQKATELLSELTEELIRTKGNKKGR
jgi:hypothetical protein